MSERFEQAVARLDADDAGVRRVAVHDLIAMGGDRVPELLAARLGRERDEKAALLIIRHLARVKASGAAPVLLGLYMGRATPVRIAHAAIVAHDTVTGP